MARHTVTKTGPRTWLAGLILWGLASLLTSSVPAAWLPVQEADEAAAAQQKQEVVYAEVSVKSSDGQPVPDAVVTPWALGSSMGHGFWSDSEIKGLKPTPVKTNAKGIAKVAFPKYAELEERVSTTTLSVSINHPDHPYVSDEHITVPLQEMYEFQFPAGAELEIKALIDGKLDSSDQIYVTSTSGRPGANRPQTKPDGSFRILPMAKGKGQLMLVRMEDKRATHFSPIVELKIDPAEGTIKKEVELQPAVSIEGKLSNNVPRPVKDGRIRVFSISAGDSWDAVTWGTWAPVEPDGTFKIEAWPAETPMQVIALCDGYYAKSGEKPSMVSPERARGSFLRPQVFMKPETSQVEVEMAPMVSCLIKVKDMFGKPIPGVKVATNPNVGWWNGGSQIYCHPLSRSSDWLVTGKPSFDAQDVPYDEPFRATSDKDGYAVMQMPVGKFWLAANNKKYQLPIKVGSRMQKIHVEPGDSLELSLVVQPKGLEVLGDWEDLCGLVFG